MSLFSNRRAITASFGFVAAIIVFALLFWFHNGHCSYRIFQNIEASGGLPDFAYMDAKPRRWSVWTKNDEDPRRWSPVLNYNEWISGIPSDERAWPALIDIYYQHRMTIYGMASGESGDFVASINSSDEEFELLKGIVNQVEQVVASSSFLGSGLYQNNLSTLQLVKISPEEYSAILRFDPDLAVGLAALSLPSSEIPIADTYIAALSFLQMFGTLLERYAVVAAMRGSYAESIAAVQAIIEMSSYCQEFPGFDSQRAELRMLRQALVALDQLADRIDIRDGAPRPMVQEMLTRLRSTKIDTGGLLLEYHDLIRWGSSAPNAAGGSTDKSVAISISASDLPRESQVQMFLINGLLTDTDSTASDGSSYVARIEEKYGCALDPFTHEMLSDAFEDKRQLDEQVSAIRARSASITKKSGLYP